MSRETQYIGLTKDAQEYIEQRAIGKKPIVVTFGMFQEDVHGYEWELPVPEGPNKRYWAKEVVQATSWSGGPMIFTCLQFFLEKGCGQVIGMGRAFEWVSNPGLDSEYDEVRGHFYV